MTTALELPETALVTFKTLEQRIESNLDGFRDVADALRIIQQEKYYLEAGYPTMEAYLDQKWGLKRSRGYALIAAGKVADSIEPVILDGKVIELTKESHANTLAAYPVELRQSIFNLTAQAHGSDFSARHLIEVGNILIAGINAGAVDRGEGEMHPLSELITTELLERTRERQEQLRIKNIEFAQKRPRNCSTCSNWTPTPVNLDYAIGFCTAMAEAQSVSVNDRFPAERDMVILAKGPIEIRTGHQFYCGNWNKNPS